MKVAGLVLAAGEGSRLGRPKAEVRVRGARLVDLAVDACVRGGLNPVVVVLGAVWLTPMSLGDDDEDGDRDDGGDSDEGGDRDGGDSNEPDIWLVDNKEWATGMASSLRAGLAALKGDLGIEAVAITLVDTPSVGAEHLRRVAATLDDGAAAAVATYRGRARTPVGLSRQVWADVAGTAAGDEGAREWLRAHPELVTEVECADLGPWTDIDTPADLPP